MAIDEDDERSKAPKPRLIPLLLDPLGVAELRAYIEELRAEIARVEAEIARKERHRSSADSIFRRP